MEEDPRNPVDLRRVLPEPLRKLLGLPAGGPGARAVLLKSGKHKRVYLVEGSASAGSRGSPARSSGSVAYFIKEYRKLPPARWWQAGREARLMERARRRGVPLHPPDQVLSRRGWGLLCFKRIAGAEILQDVLVRPPARGAGGFRDRCELLRRYARFCRGVHETGLLQQDFNPTNVLRLPGGELLVIDFERASLPRRLTRPVRLRQLAGMNRYPGASRSERLRFLLSYLEPVPRESWKETAREILSLYRKKLADTRRHGGRRSGGRQGAASPA